MELSIARSSLLNAYAAADIVNSGGIISIPGLMPLPTADYIGVTEVTNVAEVQQVVTIGATTPVITASTRYAFLIGNTAPRREGYQQSMKQIAKTSPAILTGVASADRYNIYNGMAYQINNITSIQARAYVVITVTQTNSVAFAVGEIVTETVSGATGINLSGTTGTLTIAVTSGTWSGIATGTSTAGTLTGSIAGVSTSTTHTTTTIALRIVDNSDYFNAKGTRYGANAVILTDGFASTDLVITTAAVYQRGQGTRMLQDVPVKELLSDNLARGQGSFDVDHAPSVVPTAGLTYTLFTLVWRRKVDGDIGAMPIADQQLVQNLWLNTADGDYAATRTAILAL